jgi:hypothetical protein
MPSSPAAPLPTWWLRLWIAIGMFAFALMIIVPAAIFTTFSSERNRFQACEKKEQTDCRPSMVWYFAGWVKPTVPVDAPATTTDATVENGAVVPAASTSTLPFSAAREERLSDVAPRITGIKATGAVMERGIYKMTPATTTVWTVTADDAQTVELYLKTSGAVNAPSTRVLSLKKQKDGSFQGNWKTPMVLGELEVRATGAKSSKHSLFFAVATTP